MLIDKARYFFEGNLRGFRASWSADSRWLAYSRDLDSGQTAIFLYDTKAAALHQVTAGFYADAGPVFDPEGKYLYFLTNRSFKPIYSDLDNTWVYANTTLVAAVPLRKDVAVSARAAQRRRGQGRGEGQGARRRTPTRTRTRNRQRARRRRRRTRRSRRSPRSPWRST